MLVPYKCSYYPKPGIRTHRGVAGMIDTLMSVGIMIVLGVLLFVKVFTKLDEQRDSTFSAAANTTIAGVATDFYAGVDLLRITLIVLPVVAIIGILVLIRMKN
jgi:hypothetical protein